MSDGQIRIRLSASSDAASFDRAFGDVAKRAQRAGKDIQKALNPSGSGTNAGAGAALAKSMQAAGTAAERSARQAERAWNQQLAHLNRVARAQDKLFERVESNKARAAEKSAREQVRATEKAARDRVRIEERAAREIERVGRAALREAERAEAKKTRLAEREAAKQLRDRERFASRVSHRTTRFLFPPPEGILGAAARLAGGLMRGASIDMSLQGGVQRHVALNSSTVALANSERIANGTTRGAGAYASIARTTAEQYSVGADKVQDLVTRFAAVSGNYTDLDKIAPLLTSLATATGTEDFGSVGNAAAMAYNQLKGGPNAIENMMAVMRGTLGQAAEGAVDPGDYATHMGRIAAGAFKFEGDRSQSILKLSALTQLGMERGATSAADAARGTKSFVATLGKGARLKEFDAAGVRTYADDTIDSSGRVIAGKTRDTLRDPFEIIKDSFRKTNGNIPQLGKMFMDVLGRQGVESLGAVYKSAGGGDAGISAIQAEFDRYMRANLTADTEKKNNADYQKSDAAKAQRFQNNLDKIASTMAEKVIPSLEQLAPKALMLADGMGRLIAFVAENPFKGLSIAVAAAIGRSVMEASFRRSIEKAVLGTGLGGPGGVVNPGRTLLSIGGASVTSGGMGIGGTAIAALQVATMSVGTYYAGTAYIDSLIADQAKKQTDDALDNANAGARQAKFDAAARNSSLSVSPEDVEQHRAYSERLRRRVAAAEYSKAAREAEPEPSILAMFNPFATQRAGAGALSMFDGGAAVAAQQDSQHLDSLKAELARLNNTTSDLASGILRVEVVSLPAGASLPAAGTGSTTKTE